MLNVDKMALRWNISESNQPINQSIKYWSPMTINYEAPVATLTTREECTGCGIYWLVSEMPVETNADEIPLKT